MLTLKRVGLLAVLLAIGALTAPSPALANSSNGCSGFNGHWAISINGNKTKMHITGEEGVFDSHAGSVSGQRNGNSYWGTYNGTSGGTGSFHFWLSDDQNSFSGYYYTASNPDHHIPWSGYCLGP